MARNPIIIIASVLLSALLSTAPEVSGYDVVAVTEGGTIRGKVLYTGALPPARRVIPTKDREACGSALREVQQIRFTPDRSVQDAVVYLKRVERGKAWHRPEKPPAVENLRCEYTPRVQAVPVGTELEILNSDPALHNVHGFLDKKTIFNVVMPKFRRKSQQRLKQPGLVRVECDAHGWMLGWVYVAENPYYAVTSGDGTFTLTDVPPGTYTLVAWQEHTGAVEVPVKVKANGVATVNVDLMRLGSARAERTL